MTTKPALEVDQARSLSADLVRELGAVAGDPDAVDAALLRWLEVLDAENLLRVCAAAVQLTFADCLIPTPLDNVPRDRLALIPPEGKTA